MSKGHYRLDQIEKRLGIIEENQAQLISISKLAEQYMIAIMPKKEPRTWFYCLVCKKEISPAEVYYSHPNPSHTHRECRGPAKRIADYSREQLEELASQIPSFKNDNEN